MIWKEAKTFSKVAPHEYILYKNYPKEFLEYQQEIAKHGAYQEFTIFGHTKTYKYLYLGDYKYWIVDVVLNRVKVK